MEQKARVQALKWPASMPKLSQKNNLYYLPPPKYIDLDARPQFDRKDLTGFDFAALVGTKNLMKLTDEPDTILLIDMGLADSIKMGFLIQERALENLAPSLYLECKTLDIIADIDELQKASRKSSMYLDASSLTLKLEETGKFAFEYKFKILITQYETSTLQLILNAIHTREKNIPTKISFAELTDLARFCRQYDYKQMIDEWVDNWVNAIHDSQKGVFDNNSKTGSWGHEDWILIGDTFAKPVHMMYALRTTAMEVTSRSSCGTYMMRYNNKEAARHLDISQFEFNVMIMDYITQTRQCTLNAIIYLLRSVVAELSDDKGEWFKLCGNKDCFDVAYGSLIRDLQRSGLWPLVSGTEPRQWHSSVENLITKLWDAMMIVQSHPPPPVINPVNTENKLREWKLKEKDNVEDDLAEKARNLKVEENEVLQTPETSKQTEIGDTVSTSGSGAKDEVGGPDNNILAENLGSTIKREVENIESPAFNNISLPTPDGPVFGMSFLEEMNRNPFAQPSQSSAGKIIFGAQNPTGAKKNFAVKRSQLTMKPESNEQLDLVFGKSYLSAPKGLTTKGRSKLKQSDPVFKSHTAYPKWDISLGFGKGTTNIGKEGVFEFNATSTKASGNTSGSVELPVTEEMKSAKAPKKSVKENDIESIPSTGLPPVPSFFSASPLGQAWFCEEHVAILERWNQESGKPCKYAEPPKTSNSTKPKNDQKEDDIKENDGPDGVMMSIAQGPENEEGLDKVKFEPCGISGKFDKMLATIDELLENLPNDWSVCRFPPSKVLNDSLRAQIGARSGKSAE